MASGVIRVEGLNELLVRLNREPVYAAPLNEWMEETSHDAWQVADVRSPRQIGTMAATLTERISAAPVKLWAVISTDYSVSGVRIPFVLEAGARRPAGMGRKRGQWSGIGEATIKLHYRSGPNKGKSTRAWLAGVIPIVRKRALPKLAEVERKIEALWNR